MWVNLLCDIFSKHGMVLQMGENEKKSYLKNFTTKYCGESRNPNEYGLKKKKRGKRWLKKISGNQEKEMVLKKKPKKMLFNIDLKYFFFSFY